MISQASKLERWVYLLCRGQNHTADELRALLPGKDFAQAIGALEKISAKTEDRQMYIEREKRLNDYDMIIASTLAEGIEQGIEQGLEQGIEQGLEQGIERGEMTGTIKTLQQILNLPCSTSDFLVSLSDDELKNLLAELRAKLAQR